MVARGLRALDPRPGSVLVIENVGNLVCPALFDLGEAARVVLSSVTEGADKPVKYPQMFRGADLVLLTKVDLLPYVDFDTGRHAKDLTMISPGAQILPVSATPAKACLPGTAGWPGVPASPRASRAYFLPNGPFGLAFKQAQRTRPPVPAAGQPVPDCACHPVCPARPVLRAGPARRWD